MPRLGAIGRWTGSLLVNVILLVIWLAPFPLPYLLL